MPSLHFSFECETRKIKSQYAGGILLPPVQTLVATSICAYGADRGSHSDQKSRIRFCGVWAFSHLCIKTVYQKSLIWLPCYVQLVYCYSVIVEKEIILW